MPTPPPSYSFSTEATEYGVRKSYYLTNQEGSAEVENLHVKGTLQVDGTTTMGSTLTVSAPANINGLITTNGGLSCTSGSGVTAASGTITASRLVGGSLSVAGDSIVNATNTSGAGLTVGGVAGVVNMTVPVSTLQNFQVVSAASLTTAGAITCAGPLTVQNTGITTPASITSSTYSNSSVAPVVVKVVQNGVGINGATVTAPGGNGILTLPLLTIFPGCGNFKSFKLFMSGSATDKYVSIQTQYSGNDRDTAIEKQFQSAPVGFDPAHNIKGQIQNKTSTAYQGPGVIGTYPDNLIIVPADGSTTLYQYYSTNTGGQIGYDGSASQVWLHFYPIL